MKEVLTLASFRGEKTISEEIFILNTVTELINDPRQSDARVYTLVH